MKRGIPETTKVACVAENGKLGTCTMPMPKPGQGEVLIKIAAAPDNPMINKFFHNVLFIIISHIPNPNIANAI